MHTFSYVSCTAQRKPLSLTMLNGPYEDDGTYIVESFRLPFTPKVKRENVTKRQ